MNHIWKKYILSFVIVAALIFGLINLVGYGVLRERLIETQKKQMQEEATMVARQYQSYYLEQGVTQEQLALLLQQSALYLKAEFWLVRSDGKLLAVSTGKNGLPEQEMNMLDWAPGILDCSIEEHYRFPAYGEKEFIVVVEPLLYQYVARGYLIMARAQQSVDESVRTYLMQLNIIALVVVCFLFFLVLWAILYHEDRLRRLQKAAVAYTDGDFAHELVLSGNDEYVRLGHALHYLAEQHANLVNYQKTFIANISHDFRSPLTSIKGYAEAMKDGTIPYEMQGKYLNIILFETERLSNLTNDLLDLSNFENKGVRLEYSRFDITQMLRQSAMTFEGKCAQKNLKIRMVFSDNEIIAYADRGKIQQVVHNLIDNAIKFSHENNMIEVTAVIQKGKILVSVKDHGIGIPKDSISKVWERFYKTDLSRGKDKKGTGLGLAITKQIIAAHNENIKVVSTEGIGTEFVFSLALAD